MGEPAPRRATYEDVLAAPEHLVAELIAGVLITHPRPASLHARALSRLGMDLGGAFDRGKVGPGGWILLDEPELHLREDILVPDLAGWIGPRKCRSTREKASITRGSSIRC
jgi:hypothetical protein